MDAAVVGGVFSRGKFAVLPYAGLRNILGIFIRDALVALVVVGGVGGSPPVLQVAIGVELATLIVVAVDDLVSNHRSDRAVVHRITGGGVEERRLQNAGGEVDGVVLG